MTPGYVYFFRSGSSGLIKIGFSSDPARRLRQLECATGDELEQVYGFPGSIESEHELHRHFAEDRERGEWFRPSPHLLSFLNSARAEVLERLSPSMRHGAGTQRQQVHQRSVSRLSTRAASRAEAKASALQLRVEGRRPSRRLCIERSERREYVMATKNLSTVYKNERIRELEKKLTAAERVIAAARIEVGRHDQEGEYGTAKCELCIALAEFDAGR